ncbi:hypothetical protein E2542_SST13356 [Spatholobus suberectus]|nr:hypothetical protein E2542_SST13356 [Spatholobus suberectus]
MVDKNDRSSYSPGDGVNYTRMERKRKRKTCFGNHVNDQINDAKDQSSDEDTARRGPTSPVYIGHCTPILQTPPKSILPIIGSKQTPLSNSPECSISDVDSAEKLKVRFGDKPMGRDEETDDTAARSLSSSSLYNSSLTEVDAHSPLSVIQPRNSTKLQTPPSNSTNASISHVDSAGRSGQILEAGSGVTVDLDVGDGEYVLKVKRRCIPSSTDEHRAEEIKELAQSAGMLFLQAEILRDMGEQLLAQYRASLRYVTGKPASRIDLTHP